MVTINVNGGKYVSTNGYCTIGAFSSGTVYNISGGAVVEAKADDGVAVGYAIAEDLSDNVEATITISGKGTEVLTKSDATGNNKRMFAVLFMTGHPETAALRISIENGTFDKFSAAAARWGQTSDGVLQLKVSGGAFDKDVTDYCIDGKACDFDWRTDMYIVHNASAEPPFDPSVITDECTVSIPSNIVDGTALVGVDSYNDSTGSMTINEKRVTAFNAKFSPGGHAEAVDHILPVVVFNRCVIAGKLEVFGDCSTVGRPVTIEFHDCVFDGQSHAEQFLYLQYGEKYTFTDNNYVVTDQSAVTKYNVVLDNCRFINLSPDRATRALFKGFGSTYDRPDLQPGDHFDPNENALPASTITADADSAALVNAIANASKEYKSDHQYNYFSFQAGSYGTVTNI